MADLPALLDVEELAEAEAADGEDEENDGSNDNDEGSDGSEEPAPAAADAAPTAMIPRDAFNRLVPFRRGGGQQ